MVRFISKWACPQAHGPPRPDSHFAARPALPGMCGKASTTPLPRRSFPAWHAAPATHPGGPPAVAAAENLRQTGFDI